ncbi:hypothetical protein EUBDOL_02212 [Amedibacillus dolichus DSM 3991]|nr:hypothetical protein EUBDOL_02212 [Amedibacillus dolichus DSM 3991]
MNMLRITDLKIDNKSLGDKFLLVDISPAYEYKDGERQDTVSGYKYNSSYEK